MKKAKVAEKSPKLLTEVELELMTILWKAGEATVAQVIEQLPPERSLAYTSVSTILRILEQKEIVGTRKEGRGHVYIPQLKKPDYEAQALKHVVEHVFDGAPMHLVRQLIGLGDLNESDFVELKKIIEKRDERS